jgi:arginase
VIRILHAPTPLGLKPPAEGRVPGVWQMPEALRRAGLHEGLDAEFVGEVTPPEYVADVDEATGLRNAPGIVAHARQLADRVEALLDRPGFLLVLGGDCSILIGAALGLRRRGRFGVVYIDAHPDYLTSATSETGGVAGMPLALVAGVGPEPLVAIDGAAPYIRESDIVVVGSRDPFQVRGSGAAKRVEDSEIRVHDLDDVRRVGPGPLAAEVLAGMAERGVDGVWVHLDVDVLDPAVMPAVDSPEPGGMTTRELVALLRPLVASPLVRGLEVTIYDPDRDPDGSAGRTLAGLLRESFR